MAQVWRDERVLAFLDHRPLFPGHTLVIPTAHVPTLVDADEPTLAQVMGRARAIAAVLPEALGAQGSFVAMNTVVSQSVPHWHVHVVPRRRGDGLRGFFWPRTAYAEGEAEAVAAALRAALA